MCMKHEIEDIILGMVDLVKERSYRSIEAEKEYKILQEIQSNNLSLVIAASNGWLTSEDYIDDWRHELHRGMASEKEIKPL